jgi:two-component system, chemotaxis family, sensor kinase CheA
MDDLLREFLTETAESLAVLDAELLRFESDPTDAATLGNIFRLVHTIKGTCGFLGLPRLEQIAHAGENVLGRFRDGSLRVTPQAVTAILKCIDRIRSILAALEETSAEPAGDDAALLAELAAIAAAEAPAVASLPDSPAAELVVPVQTGSDDVDGTIPASPIEDVRPIPAADAGAGDEVAVPAAEATAAPPPVPTAASLPAVAAAPAAVEPVEEARESTALAVTQQSIRVPVETLESLMNLVGELVLTRNQLLQMARVRADTSLATPLQRLSHITSELQEGVMKTRMQPISNAWSKLPRIVRDLAQETGKKLDLRLQGGETEVDRQVLELIRDPFIHMVRNAADHGIETAEERLQAGKREVGTIRLAAHHEGGHIIIEISDDGRGLDVDRIRRKALAAGLVGEADLAEMSDRQACQFVFRAGFSTADKVTSVSGRGVGMDVVRTNIEKIGGTVELESVKGQGSRFLVKIPLTLAIVSALIVTAGGQRFALPQICVVELVHVGTGSDSRIEMVRNTPLLRLRDRLLPLIDMRALLGMEAPSAAAPSHAGERSAFVIVTRVGQVRFGVIVDEVFDTEEIVVKPVNRMLRGIRYYAGNTILGDGGVVMILDPNGVAQALGQQTTQAGVDATSTERDTETKTRLLVFRSGADELKAVPLALVARIEEIDLASIEHSQSRPMIQYRGRLMPLVASNAQAAWPAQGRRPVLVFSDRGLSMGLVVDEIVDVVEEHVLVELNGREPGVVGSAIVAGRAVDLVETGHYLTQAYPDWFEPADVTGAGLRARAPRLLVVEDSAFFRDLLAPLLQAEGYEVTVVGDADHALALREKGLRFDGIVSDIEMPGMNGFEFAQQVRRDERWRGLPLLALSAHTSARDLEQGRAAGFTDYIAKFDRGGLMASLARNIRDAQQRSL